VDRRQDGRRAAVGTARVGSDGKQLEALPAGLFTADLQRPP
jgi:hypothetical protein